VFLKNACQRLNDLNGVQCEFFKMVSCLWVRRAKNSLSIEGAENECTGNDCGNTVCAFVFQKD
jgi:hypothetical protein